MTDPRARQEELGVILPEARIAAEKGRGFWAGRIITDYLDDAVAATPGRTAIAEFNSMTGQATELSYAELDRRSRRIALGLAALGIGPGDVVSFQLPNWWEFVGLVLGAVRIGAIVNPMMPIYREKDLRFMLGLAESRLLVVPRIFRGFDYAAMARTLKGELASLEHILVVGGEGEESFEEILMTRAWEDEMDGNRIFAERRPGPNDVVQLLYTSGTTGEPKGVMHSTNTLTGSLFEYSKRIGLGAEDVVIMGSPFAHQVGFLYGIMVALVHGIELIAFDIWDPAEAARLIEQRGATYTLSSTPFLADLTDLEDLDRYDISSLKAFVCGGAPVPSSLAKRAIKNLKTNIVAAWGMTENSAATITRPEDPDARVYSTDGVALPGMEVRVIGDDGQPLPAGEVGALQSKGAANFIGYLKRPELYAHDEDGWFDTGDLARMDEEGYIRITGRSKDVIIRGGENIPVAEVEDLIYTHPAILDAAIVAMQDERLGERACAFVTLKPGEKMELGELVAFLTDKEMTRTYLPERLEVIEEMPRTASGKIQKFILRETAKGFSA